MSKLADVSAGLGIGMDRLMLAYGQVKAASVLRGCLGVDTKILMYDKSVKKVQNIEVGDVLINESEQKVNVLELIRGREQMYNVISLDEDVNSYRVNEYHILTLFDVIDNCLKDIYVLDYLKEPKRYKGVIKCDTCNSLELFQLLCHKVLNYCKYRT